ncbi:MAG: hypothetical protein JXR70_14835 [Spirochaetales bacterium]|nr:hypothetical protein [Spirochaetales bacterium]
MSRFVLIVLVVLSAFPVFAEDIHFQGDSMNTVLARGKKRTILTGNAYLETKDNLIKADHIELFGDDFEYVSCEGNIDVQNVKEGLHINANRLFYDRTEKRIVFYENAVLQDLENELIVKGDYIESWEEEEITIIQIGVRIIREDMICRSEMARYIRKEDRLELSGIPRVQWKGDEYNALKINIDLKNDEILLEGDVQGEVFWESEESDKASELDKKELTPESEIPEPLNKSDELLPEKNPTSAEGLTPVTGD